MEKYLRNLEEIMYLFGLNRESFLKETIPGALEDLFEILEVASSSWAFRRIETKSKAGAIEGEVWKAEQWSCKF